MDLTGDKAPKPTLYALAFDLPCAPSKLKLFCFEIK